MHGRWGGGDTDLQQHHLVYNKANQPSSGDLCGNITEFGVAKGAREMYICIHKLSRWLTFWIYLTVPTHTNVLDNSCTEKSYWMLHNARDVYMTHSPLLVTVVLIIISIQIRVISGVSIDQQWQFVSRACPGQNSLVFYCRQCRTSISSFGNPLVLVVVKLV